MVGPATSALVTHPHPVRRGVGLLALAVVALAGCKDPTPIPDDTDPEDTAPDLFSTTLTFQGRVGPDAFSCTREFQGLGSARASSVRFQDFRMFIHNVGWNIPTSLAQEIAPDLVPERDELPEFVLFPAELPRDDWSTGAEVLLDFEDAGSFCAEGTPATNTTLLVTAPREVVEAGELTLSIGLPFRVNHREPTLTTRLPLGEPAMFKSIVSGYYFVKVDLITAQNLDGHPLHVHSIGCTFENGQVTGCASANTLPFTFPDFDYEADQIVFDLEALAGRSDLDSNAFIEGTETATQLGCQSDARDPDCQDLFISYGLSALAPTWVFHESIFGEAPDTDAPDTDAPTP